MKRVKILVDLVVNPYTFEVDMHRTIKNSIMDKYPAVKGFVQEDFGTYALVEDNEDGSAFALKFTDQYVT